MADEVIGGVSVEIRGDYSQLGADFDAAVAEAVAAGQTLAEAITTAMAAADTSAATEGLAAVGTAATDAIPGVDALGKAVTDSSAQLGLFGDALDSVPFSDATGQLNLFTGQLEGFQGAAADATAGLHDLAEAEDEVKEHSEEAGSALGTLREQLLEFGEALVITEGLREFGQEALETYAEVEKLDVALTAMTGSAGLAALAIEDLKQLSLDTATSFSSLSGAFQSMTAKFIGTGIGGEQITVALRAMADAAAVLPGGFDRVDNAIERMVLSGTAGARQLTSLGMNLGDLGQQMVSVTTGLTRTADEAAAAFKSLDVSDRLTVMIQGLGKYAGDAALVANTLGGIWQNLKTQTEFAFEGIGKALAPVFEQINQFIFSDIHPFFQSLIDDFNALPGPAKDTFVALSLIVATLAPLAVGLAGFGLLLTGLEAALPAITALLGTLGIEGGFAGLGAAVLAATPYVVAFATALEAIHFTGVDSAMMGWIGNIQAQWPGLVAAFNDLNDAAGWAKQPDEINAVSTAEYKAAEGMKEWGTASQFLDGVPRMLDAISVGYAGMAASLLGVINNLNRLSDPNLAQGYDSTKGPQQVPKLTPAQVAAISQAATESVLRDSGYYLGGTQLDRSSTIPNQMTPDQFQAMQDAATEFNKTLETTNDDEDTIFDSVTRVGQNIEQTGSDMDPVNAAIRRAYESSEMWNQGVSAVDETWKDVNVQMDNSQGYIGTISEGWDQVSSKGRNAIQQIDQAISSGLAKSLTDLITGTTSVTKAFENMATQVANIILTTLIKAALTPLLADLQQLLTQLPLVGGGFGSLFQLLQPTHSLYTSPIGPSLPPASGGAAPSGADIAAAVPQGSGLLGTGYTNPAPYGSSFGVPLGPNGYLPGQTGLGSSSTIFTPEGGLPVAGATQYGGVDQGSTALPGSFGVVQPSGGPTDADYLQLGTQFGLNTVAVGINTDAIKALTAASGTSLAATYASTAQNVAMGNVVQGAFAPLPPQLLAVHSSLDTLDGNVTDLGGKVVGNTNELIPNTAAILPDTTAVTDNSSAVTSLTGDFSKFFSTAVPGTGVPMTPSGGIPGASVGGGTGSGAAGTETGGAPVGMPSDVGSIPGGSTSIGGGVTGSGEAGVEGSAMPSANTVFSGQDVGLATASAGSGAGNFLGLGTSPLGAIGAVVSVIQSIIADLQTARTNDLLYHIQQFEQGSQQQLVSIQNTLNEYQPNLLHLVDIWGAILQLQADFVQAAIVATNPSGTPQTGVSPVLPTYGSLNTIPPTSGTGVPLVTVTDSSGNPIDPATTSDITAHMGPSVSGGLSTGRPTSTDPVAAQADALQTQAQAIQTMTAAIPASAYYSAGSGLPIAVQTTFDAIKTSQLTPAQIAMAPGGGGTPGTSGPMSTVSFAAGETPNTGSEGIGSTWYDNAVRTVTYYTGPGAAAMYGALGAVGNAQPLGPSQLPPATQSLADFTASAQAAAQAAANLAAAQKSYNDSLTQSNLKQDTGVLTRPGANALFDAPVNAFDGVTINYNPANGPPDAIETQTALGLARAMANPQDKRAYAAPVTYTPWLAGSPSSPYSPFGNYPDNSLPLGTVQPPFSFNPYPTTPTNSTAFVSSLSTALATALQTSRASMPVNVTVNTVNPLTAFVSGIRNVGVKL